MLIHYFALHSSSTMYISLFFYFIYNPPLHLLRSPPLSSLILLLIICSLSWLYSFISLVTLFAHRRLLDVVFLSVLDSYIVCSFDCDCEYEVL